MVDLPRVVIAAPASGHGKTTVATGLLKALAGQGVRVAGFKVGPDYIDPSYHELASGRPGRNLDPVLVGDELIGPLFVHGAAAAEVCIVEGVMGLFDGRVGAGDFGSTAHVARLLDAPVVLVVDARGQGRSIAALIHGFRMFAAAMSVAPDSGQPDQPGRHAAVDQGALGFGAGLGSAVGGVSYARGDGLRANAAGAGGASAFAASDSGWSAGRGRHAAVDHGARDFEAGPASAFVFAGGDGRGFDFGARTFGGVAACADGLAARDPGTAYQPARHALDVGVRTGGLDAFESGWTDRRGRHAAVDYGALGVEAGPASADCGALGFEAGLASAFGAGIGGALRVPSDSSRAESGARGFGAGAADGGLASSMGAGIGDARTGDARMGDGSTEPARFGAVGMGAACVGGEGEGAARIWGVSMEAADVGDGSAEPARFGGVSERVARFRGASTEAARVEGAGAAGVRIAGVILNRVGSDRHEQVLREACAEVGMPVLGVLRRSAPVAVPSRHLGLVPVAERTPEAVHAVEAMASLVAGGVDLNALLAVARSAPPLRARPWAPPVTVVKGRPTVAVAGGPAFSFGYREQLELLAAAGADVQFVDPLRDEKLPPGTKAMIVNGGFPEVYGEQLAANDPLRRQVRELALSGAPIVAECAGLLWLGRMLDGHEMCGVLDSVATMTDRLTLGYRDAVAVTASVLTPAGTRVTGHEFHRTHTTPECGPRPAWSGASGGFVQSGVHASYLHTHWAGHPGFAQRFVEAAAASCA